MQAPAPLSLTASTSALVTDWVSGIQARIFSLPNLAETSSIK